MCVGVVKCWRFGAVMDYQDASRHSFDTADTHAFEFAICDPGNKPECFEALSGFSGQGAIMWGDVVNCQYLQSVTLANGLQLSKQPLAVGGFDWFVALF